MKFIHNDPLFKPKRQSLRNCSTPEEIILWNHLKRSRIGAPFRRQFGIGRYIVDFYCPIKKLVIELDGEYHIDTLEHDRKRDEFLRLQGCVVLRFPNSIIHKDLERVLKTIKKFCMSDR